MIAVSVEGLFHGVKALLQKVWFRELRPRHQQLADRPAAHLRDYACIGSNSMLAGDFGVYRDQVYVRWRNGS